MINTNTKTSVGQMVILHIIGNSTFTVDMNATLMDIFSIRKLSV